MADKFISRDDLIKMIRSSQEQLEMQEQFEELLLRALEEKSDAENMLTPKKVILQALEDDDGNKATFLECPTCRIRLNYFDARKYVTYCSNCGQALDWTEVDE